MFVFTAIQFSVHFQASFSHRTFTIHSHIHLRLAVHTQGTVVKHTCALYISRCVCRAGEKTEKLCPQCTLITCVMSFVGKSQRLQIAFTNPPLPYSTSLHLSCTHTAVLNTHPNRSWCTFSAKADMDSYFQLPKYTYLGGDEKELTLRETVARLEVGRLSLDLR